MSCKLHGVLFSLTPLGPGNKALMATYPFPQFMDPVGAQKAISALNKKVIDRNTRALVVDVSHEVSSVWRVVYVYLLGECVSPSK